MRRKDWFVLTGVLFMVFIVIPGLGLLLNHFAPQP